ncbi:undecaprenyldiphospho-muramoylpentapeptide beta-N-acetylglucosaminyltransferase [Clostridium sp. LBM24168]
MKKIILTGGGSAGHVTPNLALVPGLKQKGYSIEYIGTKDGIERKIITAQKIKYYVISSGKLRRYFDIKNFTDPFKVVRGVFQALLIIRKVKPNIVFSKGGFVSVPVVIAAYLSKVPVIAHESDITPGLANRISAPYCNKICVTFPESLNKIKDGKGILTGTPIRREIINGSKIIGRRICNFKDDKPVILIVGGSLGSKFINNMVRNSLDVLLRRYNVIHICGRGNIDKKMEGKTGYLQFEYVNEDMPHILNISDIVISRAGANAIFELLALKKPNMLIPLSRKSSRGDQILNAASFEKRGYSMVLSEDILEQDMFVKKIDELYCNRNNYINKMARSNIGNGSDRIIEVIEKYSIK